MGSRAALRSCKRVAQRRLPRKEAGNSRPAVACGLSRPAAAGLGKLESTVAKKAIHELTRNKQPAEFVVRPISCVFVDRASVILRFMIERGTIYQRPRTKDQRSKN